MESENSYCFAVNNGDLSKLHKAYHDTEYGFKANSDNSLFGSLILEINQLQKQVSLSKPIFFSLHYNHL